MDNLRDPYSHVARLGSLFRLDVADKSSRYFNVQYPFGSL